LPTVASSGLPGYEAGSNLVIFAPGNTPAPIIKRLNQEIVRGLNRAEVKDKILSLGSEVAPTSPAELAAFVKADLAKMGKLMKDADITVE
jgi:tripartite-type tricarboxylate transporter receptor subunit TctC